MRVENVKARDYYIEQTIAQNWSTRALERQINSFYYERIIPQKTKRKLVMKQELVITNESLYSTGINKAQEFLTDADLFRIREQNKMAASCSIKLQSRHCIHCSE